MAGIPETKTVTGVEERFDAADRSQRPTVPPAAGDSGTAHVAGLLDAIPTVPRRPEQRAVTERISALLIKFRFSRLASDPTAADEAFQIASPTVLTEAERFRGAVATSIGSVFLVLFGECAESAECADDAAYAVRAVRIAAAVRDAAPTAVGAAVTTGEALLRYGGVTGVTAVGPVIDTCQSLLEMAGDNEIRVCANTRRNTIAAIAYECGGDATVGWPVASLREDRTPEPADRGLELDVLQGLFQQTRGETGSYDVNRALS
ncbi:hypothetical protein [Streptomyces yunnanensis]|uniref:Uncharacterized protein n=1 Tax=Streptomyces yunnanensis TaxID=156453 RepID=A0A9X8N750_9ACTN|nr:hypothetical protein [Streptomyces yunnanensis]SHN20400.1 hypothetical protein SAMN05216268_123146 [Streptomyces yunnanensis]